MYLQSSAALLVLGLDIHTLLQEELHQLCIAGPSRQHQQSAVLERAQGGRTLRQQVPLAVFACIRVFTACTGQQPAANVH